MRFAKTLEHIYYPPHATNNNNSHNLVSPDYYSTTTKAPIYIKNTDTTTCPDHALAKWHIPCEKYKSSLLPVQSPSLEPNTNGISHVKSISSSEQLNILKFRLWSEQLRLKGGPSRLKQKLLPTLKRLPVQNRYQLKRQRLLLEQAQFQASQNSQGLKY